MKILLHEALRRYNDFIPNMEPRPNQKRHMVSNFPLSIQTQNASKIGPYHKTHRKINILDNKKQEPVLK